MIKKQLPSNILSIFPVRKTQLLKIKRRVWIPSRSVSSGGLFSVRTPPTAPNHQLQWTPPTCMLNPQLQWTPMDSNGLQWTPMGISLYSFQICNSNGLQWTPMGISLYVDLACVGVP